MFGFLRSFLMQFRGKIELDNLLATCRCVRTCMYYCKSSRIDMAFFIKNSIGLVADLPDRFRHPWHGWMNDVATE